MVTLGEIVDAIRDDVAAFRGDRAFAVESPAPISSAASNEITFCNRPLELAVKLIEESSCNTFVVEEALKEASFSRSSLNLIFAKNSRLAFARVISRCFAAARPMGVHPSANVDPEADIHPTAYVGPLSYVGKSSIGEGSVLWGGNFVYDRVSIGRNVVVHAGTVIGADGFGYERDEAGHMEKFPHIGGIVIEDDVEIGSNTCIDRGTLGNTVLARGAKVDNLVHIAHNVRVGEDAVVIAHAMVGGSTRIGPRAWIAPSACLRDQLTIGEDAVVGLAAVVTKNVADHETVMGSPARPMSEQSRIMKALKTLGENAG